MAALRSDWLTQGPTIERFEKCVADYCGAKHAVAVCNGTAALHLAGLALDLKPGDTLWTSPNTFVASANCALYCGANVDFVDIDPRTDNLSLEKLRQKLEAAGRAGNLPKIVVPVHFAGQPCEMTEIFALSRRYGFRVLKMLRMRWQRVTGNSPVGDCRFSDVTVFSFHPVKIITTGEGGMLLTNRADLYEKFLRLRTHGITRDPDKCAARHTARGITSRSNWASTTVSPTSNARWALSQMKRLGTICPSPPATCAALRQVTGRSAGEIAVAASRCRIKLAPLRRPAAIGQDSKIAPAGFRGIARRWNWSEPALHSRPHTAVLPATRFRAGQFPEAETLYTEALSLPMFYGLSDAGQNRVVSALGKIL